jgi:aminodeoxyfutalosine synthase
MAVLNGELVSLAAGFDIITLGMRADAARKARHGARTTFVRVADVPSEIGAEVAIPPSAGEVRIVGMPASHAAAIQRVKEVRAVAGHAPLSGFALDDLERLALREHVTLRRLLDDLRAAGLECVAWAPIDRVQDPRGSIEEINIAGLTLARLTCHQWAAADLLSLFAPVAELQRSVGVIRAFAPLPRQWNPAAPTTGYQDVKAVALARLVVDNVPSIQVDWSLYGPKLAQVALMMGADDVDGVSAVDDDSRGRRRSPLEEICRNIRAAGFEPVERDGRFDPTDR